MSDALSASAPSPTAPTTLPWLGLLAVLLGTFISTLNGRLSSLGIADIRGAVHAGFDEGAWITTAQTAAQMLVAPFAVWAGTIHGPRGILIIAALGFAVTSTITPFAENLPALLVLQFLGGLFSGCFVPLTLSFILRRMPPYLWAYGVAVYALNLELSLNLSASFEGWYTDHLDWRWIYWQNVPLSLGMAACLILGEKRLSGPPPQQKTDWFGLGACGAGLALIYAALDQGNRLDWLNNGLICALLLSGAIVTAAFLVHAARTPESWIDLRIAFRMPTPLLMLMVATVRLSVLSTAFLIPQFLTPVRGFRALEVGQTLNWVAFPQLLVCPLGAFLLRRSDPRITAAIGLLLVAYACLIVASNLTPLWGTDQFLLSQLLQALGQSLALSGIVFISVLNLRPEHALTLGAMLQIARLMGGELSQAFISTLVRIREQHASNLLGLHVQSGDVDVINRIQLYSHVLSRTGVPDSLAGTDLLANAVRSAATVQSVIDGFVGVAAVIGVALILLLFVKAPPQGPASHIPLFGRRREGSGA